MGAAHNDEMLFNLNDFNSCLILWHTVPSPPHLAEFFCSVEVLLTRATIVAFRVCSLYLTSNVRRFLVRGPAFHRALLYKLHGVIVLCCLDGQAAQYLPTTCVCQSLITDASSQQHLRSVSHRRRLVIVSVCTATAGLVLQPAGRSETVSQTPARSG